MLWFKHLKDARNDPFVFDLRQRFGPVGYYVYFATLEIYADSFKPVPGWYLDVSIDYLKHELGIYHLKKLKQIIDFIRQWPEVDGIENRPILDGQLKGDFAPKWVAQLTGTRIAILIPAFSQLMDNYTAQKMREGGGQEERTPGTGKSRVLDDVALIFRDIARDCETLAGQTPGNGRGFNGSDFVGWCVKNNYHPGAIRDSIAAMVQQSKTWADINDPWAYARGIVKTRAEYYAGDPINPDKIKCVFGNFFKSKAKGGDGATSN
jgi:hypothetical protein